MNNSEQIKSGEEDNSRGIISNIAHWLKFGIDCFKSHLLESVAWGVVFTTFVYLIFSFLKNTSYADISLPILGFAVLILGPMMALNMYYLAAKHHQSKVGFEKDYTITQKQLSSSMFVGFILIIIFILYLMIIPAIFAISTSGSLLIASDSGMGVDLTTVVNNPMFLFIGSVWTIFVSWVVFSISWFSYPMIISNRLSPVVAIMYSIKMSKKNWKLMLVWMPVVGSLVLLSLFVPYFATLIIIAPILAFATFDANRILSREINIIDVTDDKYIEKLKKFSDIDTVAKGDNQQ